MKFLKQGVCLALLGAGLAAVPASLTTATAATPPAAVAGDRALVSTLRNSTDGSLSIRNNAATGQAGFIRAAGQGADLLPGTAGDSAKGAAAKADAFVAKYGSLLGAAKGQLVQKGVTPSGGGFTVSYTQAYQGVPVYGSMIKANVDAQGDLTAVNGFAAPDIDVSTEPTFGGAEISRRAVLAVQSDPPSEDSGAKADTSGLASSGAQLVIYRIGFVKGQPGESVLAWAVRVGNGAIEDQLIYDAHTGKILNRFSLSNDNLDRELREASGPASNPTFTTVWEEEDEFPGDLNQDQQNLVESSGESYWFFQKAFGRDSYDGEGAKRITVNNDPRINCPNANWNGSTTNYCDGVTSDDVVAHEWGHAYTEYTSGLIYQYQSGALNESYSDVWGESLDLINGREDEGEVFDVKRPDGECEPTAPPALQMTITAPTAQQGVCTAVAAGFGEEFTTDPMDVTVVRSLDAANAAGPTVNDGCTAYTNAAAVDGNWAFADRGTCTFQVKVDNAVAAGAEGLVIGNNQVGLPPSPAGTAPDGFYGAAVTQADGARFKAAVTASVTVNAEDISERTDSTRWSIGEKSEAFGGAIRDMWTPTCYGDPGKVTDAEYNCDPLLTDNGGVHGNSGVPNHAYALAVDGGTYNGQTITGMGLDQAAAIWYRAGLAYLTPSSNFGEFATALETSCADLVGQPIFQLTTDEDATPTAATPVTAANCTELGKVITAVELRTEVTQCNYVPVLEPGAPALCSGEFSPETLYYEDFEDGLAGLGTDQEIADVGGDPEGFGAPWEASTSAPGGHAGGVAYGPAPDEGKCDGSDEDFSSRDSILTPTLEVPSGNVRNLTLSFDHYVATEATVDGGNVKMSVNGGDFVEAPADAFIFNAPNSTLLSAGAGNTNPMASEDAWSGTDGGQSRGSWGQSQLDLGAAGVEAGDTVQLRFDIGRDGCGGNDGWYVDNVLLTVCKIAATVTATHTPEPVAQGEESVVNVQVRKATTGPVATGTVVLFGPTGAYVSEASLNAVGDAVLDVPGTFPAGTHTFTVQYLGDDATAKASKPVTVTVKGATATSAKADPKKVQRGKAFDVDVTVTGGTGLTGAVQIVFKGKVLATGQLGAGGKVTIKVSKKKAKKLALGKNTLTAKYLGSAPSQGDFVVKVKPKKKG